MIVQQIDNLIKFTVLKPVLGSDNAENPADLMLY